MQLVEMRLSRKMMYAFACPRCRAMAGEECKDSNCIHEERREEARKWWKQRRLGKRRE